MNEGLLFHFQPGISVYIGSTYQEGTQKYQVASVSFSNFTLINNFPTHLIVADDNSALASEIRNDNNRGSFDKYFTTPFSNVKFRPNFLNCLGGLKDT